MKMAPVSRGLDNNRANYFIFHAGQHYSYNLNKVFFEQQKFANKVSRFALVLNPEHRVSSPKD
jgi:UDP-N-acetylglucosamine 2-epimerase